MARRRARSCGVVGAVSLCGCAVMAMIAALQGQALATGRPHGAPRQLLLLRLRGGGGVFDGQLSEAHGLGRVSETLLMRERMGANCGDPPNVPPDITSHHHLDSLSPQHLFESIGTEAALTPSGELTPEWEEQGRNFLKAHVARGAAMVADMRGASLHLARALHARFDADSDGFMQREDLEALLAATEPAAYQAEQAETGRRDRVTADAWRKILNDTESDPAEGLSARALLWLYSKPGEDLRKDCWTVFGTEGMADIPHYNPIFDIFPDPNMFRAAPPASDQTPQPPAGDQPAESAGAGAGSGSGAQEAPKLRRWVLEEGDLAADHDVWDDKTLPELMPAPDPAKPGRFWHEEDWSAVDLRLLRDLLLETSLKADCKQRPSQSHPNTPPIMATPGILLHRPLGPVERFGLTLDEYMEMCRLPEHTSFGGRHFNYSKHDRGQDAAPQRSQRLCTNSRAAWRALPSVVGWAAGLSNRDSRVLPLDAAVSPTGEEERVEEEERVHDVMEDEQREEAMRGEATQMLRRVAARFGAANAEALTEAELNPRLDENGEVVLPDWLSWSDLQEMEGMGGLDRDVLALLFARSLNSHERYEDITAAKAQGKVDPLEPLPFNFDGHPWVYDRPTTAQALGLSLRQDPWSPASRSIQSIVERHQGVLGGDLERVVATGNRRKSFKLLMAGPDGGGKSSLLFCWKANQPLRDAGLETVPTVYDFNVEEVGYKDAVFVCWDMGGPDDLRAYMPPTADPSSVDALVFVVDAVRIRNDTAYSAFAKEELWRHLEGDLLTADIAESEARLRESLAAHAGPEDPEEPWEPLPLGPGEKEFGAVPDDAGDVHYLPRQNQTLLAPDGSPARKPADAGFWLRHVRKVLVIANKCEAVGRASLDEVAAALELDKIQSTRLNSADLGGSPIVVMPHHPEVPRIWHLQAASSHAGYGVLDGLEWLYHVLEGDALRSG